MRGAGALRRSRPGMSAGEAVDVRGVRPYVARGMNLLLLLSALLSALTGVDTRARGIDRAPAVAERVVAAAREGRVVAARQRLADPLPAPGVLARVRVALPEAPRPVAPLFLSRRRE